MGNRRMKYMSKLVALLAVLAFAWTGAASMAYASTSSQKQNFSIFQAQKKKPATAKKKHNECAGPFKCLFRGTSRRTAGASMFGGFTGRGFRQTVSFDDPRYRPGSIVIRTPERALYLVLPEGEAIRYRVGVGREGFQWAGSSRIVAKKEWPSWTPPPQMIAREAAKGVVIPPYMEGGPRNPLGARALYIGGTLYRIHGTNNARSIGGAVSSGCIRMLNADVIDLYKRVSVGAPVHVIQ
jgi:lipoprotein-anchoring transpeptidase ErfK/SrfK